MGVRHMNAVLYVFRFLGWLFASIFAVLTIGVLISDLTSGRDSFWIISNLAVGLLIVVIGIAAGKLCGRVLRRRQ